MCLVYTMAGVAGFDWCAVAERLRLHDLWDREVESKLAVCEMALLEVYSELKEDDGENILRGPGS